MTARAVVPGASFHVTVDIAIDGHVAGTLLTIEAAARAKNRVRRGSTALPAPVTHESRGSHHDRPPLTRGEADADVRKTQEVAK